MSFQSKFIVFVCAFLMLQMSEASQFEYEELASGNSFNKLAIENWIINKLKLIEERLNLSTSELKFLIKVNPHQDEAVNYYDSGSKSVVLGLETIKSSMETNKTFTIYHEIGHHYFSNDKIDSFYREAFADLFAIALADSQEGLINTHEEASQTYCSTEYYDRTFTDCNLLELFKFKNTLRKYKIGLSVYEFSSVFNSYIHNHENNKSDLVIQLLGAMYEGKLINLPFDYSWINSYLNSLSVTELEVKVIGSDIQFDLNFVNDQESVFLSVSSDFLNMQSLVLLEFHLENGKIIKVQPSSFFQNHTHVIPYRFTGPRFCDKSSIILRAYYVKGASLTKTQPINISSPLICNMQDIDKVFYF